MDVLAQGGLRSMLLKAVSRASLPLSLALSLHCALACVSVGFLTEHNTDRVALDLRLRASPTCFVFLCFAVYCFLCSESPAGT